MTTSVLRNPNMQATALMVYNLPTTVDEREIRSIFPSAQHVRLSRHSADSSSSQSMCTVQFDNPHECQKVYAECQSGKTVGGRMVHVEFASNWNTSSTEAPREHKRSDAQHWAGQGASYEDSYSYSDNTNYDSNQSNRESSHYGQNPQGRSRDMGQTDDYQRRSSGSDRFNTAPDRYAQARSDQPRSAPQRSGARNDSGRPGCTLTVSNLPYSATEADVKREFVDAFKVILNLNDQGQSRGVAQVSFSTPEQCNAALYACNQKTMGGRTLRGRIQRDDENGHGSYPSRDSGSQRDHSGGRRDMNTGHRNYGDGDREYGNNRNEFGGAPRGAYGQQRGYGGGREFGNRGGGQYRGDGNRRGGNTGGPGGGRMNDYNYGRMDRDNRHPIGGAGGGGGGAQGNRFGQRDSREDRRERSPNRNEPVRGYGGGKGPRITSAVIRGTHDRSSSSESSDSDE